MLTARRFNELPSAKRPDRAERASGSVRVGMRFCPPDRTRAESLNYGLNFSRSGGQSPGRRMKVSCQDKIVQMAMQKPRQNDLSESCPSDKLFSRAGMTTARRLATLLTLSRQQELSGCNKI
jgi:hypothetical protein